MRIGRGALAVLVCGMLASGALAGKKGKNPDKGKPSAKAGPGNDAALAAAKAWLAAGRGKQAAAMKAALGEASWFWYLDDVGAHSDDCNKWWKTLGPVKADDLAAVARCVGDHLTGADATVTTKVTTAAAAAKAVDAGSRKQLKALAKDHTFVSIVGTDGDGWQATLAAGTAADGTVRIDLAAIHLEGTPPE